MRFTPTVRPSSTARTRRLPSSTGCTPERKTRANRPSTTPSRRCSKSRRMRMARRTSLPWNRAPRRQSTVALVAASPPKAFWNPSVTCAFRRACATIRRRLYGRVAELADAQDSGSCVRKDVGVQVPLRPPSMSDARRPDPVVLSAPRLLDGTGAGPVADAAVWLEAGRVAYAGPAAGLPAGAAQAPACDFPGATLLPGLVDAHVHLVASAGPDLAADVPGSEAERTLAAVANARRQLDAGVTLVRDLGAPGAEVVAVARAIEAGRLEGPRVLASGPAITMTGGHIAFLGRVTDGVDAMRAAVRANLA